METSTFNTPEPVVIDPNQPDILPVPGIPDEIELDVQPTTVGSTTLDPTTFESTTEELTTVDPTTVSSATAGPLCSDGFFGNVQNPELCNSYYLCAGSIPIQLYCPSGYEYSSSSKASIIISSLIILQLDIQ